MTVKYLITGATGGLGGEVLAHLAKHLPSAEFAAASSNESSRSRFETEGITYRVANFDDPATLETAFADVENLYFVSTSTFDNARRMVQHRNVVEAAKRAGVKHVWYTSLAFGGLRSDSKISLQYAHLETEKILKESGLTYTSIREGIYADAFPIYLQWYPSTETVILPHNGAITYTSRAELGEANARLLLKGGHDNEIVLLTANEPLWPADIIHLINEVTSRNVKLQITSSEEYVRYHTANDIGKKPESFWRSILSWLEGIAQGDAEVSDPLMKELLGREPKPGSQLIREFLAKNPNYTWHQNYINRVQYEATLREIQ